MNTLKAEAVAEFVAEHTQRKAKLVTPHMTSVDVMSEAPKRCWRSRVGLTAREHFWLRVQKTASCWIWCGVKGADGYGAVVAEGVRLAHRVSLHFAGVSIPDGMRVDHKCRNRACVNPDHLRVVDARTNALENSNGQSALNAIKTHCLRGHLFDEKNTRYLKNGARQCRACVYINNLAGYRRRKALEAA